LSALFPSLLDEILFWVIFVGGLVGVRLPILRAGSARQPDKKKATEPALAMVSLFLFGVIMVPILVAYARVGVLPSYVFYPGLIIMIIGFAISYWAVQTLGRFNSGIVRVIPDHKVVQKGPYRFVGHPIYASEILTVIGLGLALQSWVALLIILIGAGVFYGNRIRIEERFLASELGDEYVQYMKSVKRIIPHIL
jgi:protein-S-isoprenylcysteine O-methyltransferase Ste14